MVEKEFNLSEKMFKIEQINDEEEFVYVAKEENIKEFIKRLKKEMCRCRTMVGEGKKCFTCRNIDKLAGDKLISSGEDNK